MRGNPAETGERLAATAAAASPAGFKAAAAQGLLLVLTPDTLSSYPPGRLLFSPVAEHERQAPESAFAEGEAAEIRQQQLDKAAGAYRRSSETNDRALQAGALMRLARVLRKSGQIEAARAVYERLSRMDGVRVAGAPAELVARHALCDLSHDSADGMRLQEDLLAGRWALTRGQSESYWAEAARLSGHEERLAETAGLAEAAAVAWSEWKRASSIRGQRTIWIDGRAWFMIWRAVSGRHRRNYKRRPPCRRALLPRHVVFNSTGANTVAGPAGTQAGAP